MHGISYNLVSKGHVFVSVTGIKLRRENYYFSVKGQSRLTTIKRITTAANRLGWSWGLPSLASRRAPCARAHERYAVNSLGTCLCQMSQDRSPRGLSG